jgi:hypothetical protein
MATSIYSLPHQIIPSHPCSHPTYQHSSRQAKAFSRCDHIPQLRIEGTAFLSLLPTSIIIMGRWQPYLYNAPARNSMYDVPDVFNPKAVTEASRRPPSPKKKQDGPLVNFNRHPDSYLVLPYGNTGAKPMKPKTKTIIKLVRWLQLFLRVLTLFGAIGALLVAIFIRGATSTEGYIIRIPVSLSRLLWRLVLMRLQPGVDIVNTLYAVYHLFRSAKSRPAGSSASYHFFALVMDAGFIPFYVFTALLSKRNYNQDAGTNGRWRTFFPTDEETNKVLHTTWLCATTVGGLHIASLFLGLYLAIVFRKISKLPPDMNPLEENLTSRRKTKHKHKNSSVSAIAPLTGDEKRFSTQSGATTLVGNRNSQADPLISEKDEPRAMSFMHTRTNSDMTYSPHTPRSARQSRSLYSQPASARQSRADLNSRDDLHRRDDDSDSETLAQRKSYLAQQAIKRSSRPNSMVSSKQEYYTPPSTARQDANGDIALQDSLQGLQSDNWFVHEGRFDDPHEEHQIPEVPEPTPTYVQVQKISSVPRKAVGPTSEGSALFGFKKGYNAVSMDDVSDVSDDEVEAPMVPQPLRMNPPTPPPVQALETPEVRQTPPPLQRTNTVTTLSSDATFSRSPTRTSTPKSRYYGDLRAATQGIREGRSARNSPAASPTKPSTPNNLPSATKQYTTNASPVKSTNNSPFSLNKNAFASVRRTGDANHTPTKAQSPRVVSRTGVDYDGRYDFTDDDISDLGTHRRRDVSGKIAEEGLGGRFGNWGGNELTYRKVSGMA